MPSEMPAATNTFLTILGFIFFKEGLNERPFPTCEPPDMHRIYDCLAP